MTGSQAAELDAPIPARKAGRGGEQQPSTGLTQETEWQPDWRQKLGLRNHGASSGQTDPTPRRRRPGRRHDWGNEAF